LIAEVMRNVERLRQYPYSSGDERDVQPGLFYLYLMYNVYMEVTISRFRRDLFTLVEAALNGEKITFTHKGIHFKVTPEIETSRLSQLTPIQIVDPKTSDLDGKDLVHEMEKAWEKDWANL
jgi:hypothetical protein